LVGSIFREWGVCNQVAGPERGYNTGNLGYLKKIFLSQTTGPNTFGMKHPWDKEMFPQKSSRGHIGVYIAKLIKLRKGSHKPLARVLFKLAWSILGTRRFKFVQMKSLGSQMALALNPERGQRYFFLLNLMMNQ